MAWGPDCWGSFSQWDKRALVGSMNRLAIRGLRGVKAYRVSALQSFEAGRYPRLLQQPRQGDVGRNPPRLVAREHYASHCCNTRVRWRIVSLILGRCMMDLANICCAFARLLPA